MDTSPGALIGAAVTLAIGIIILTPAWQELLDAWRARRWVRRALTFLNTLPASWTLTNLEECRTLRLHVQEMIQEGEKWARTPAPTSLHAKLKTILSLLKRHKEGLGLQARVLFQEQADQEPPGPFFQSGATS